MNKIERIGDSNLAFIKYNYRKTDPAEYRQESNNARYEGYMRSDFTAPNIGPMLEYTYDRLEIVRLGVEL